MPRPRRQPKTRARDLDFFERTELCIGDGPGSRSCFASEAARRSAWHEHGGEITADYQQPGRRPWAYWAFDGPADIAADERRLRFDAMTSADRMRLDQDLERRQVRHLLDNELLSDAEVEAILVAGERDQAGPDARQHAVLIRQWQVQSLVTSVMKGAK